MIKEGDIIKFGKYPQGFKGLIEPIEWLVLEVKPDEALLISRYALDCKEFDKHKFTDITWEDCDLRKWLNNDFIKSAFSEEETRLIKISELDNSESSFYETVAEKNTKDYIFCLSVDEAKKYFKNDRDRRCKPTYFSLEQGTSYDLLTMTCYWWLRSLEEPYIHRIGVIDALGDYAQSQCPFDFLGVAVRPALRLILNRGEL